MGVLSLMQRRIFPGAFDITVDNLQTIALAYGEGCAARVLAELAARIERILGLSAQRPVVTAAGVRFFCRSQANADSLLYHAAMPVAVGNVRIVMALRLSSTRDVSPSSPFALSPLATRDIPAFWADMTIAASVYEAALCERTHLLVQPVDSTSNGGSLYWECLSRVTDENDNLLSPGVFIPALERLGLIRFYDVHIVRSTLDLLRRAANVSLGCNISALSAVDDAWWSPIAADLAEDRELASRLVIEITETAYPADTGDVVAFIAKMRSLGCRVALDDFGKGFHSVDFARSARPDLIKIDASFLPRDPQDLAGRQLLVQLIALGGVLAGTVIVEGVEDAGAYETAVTSGASWVQGYYIAMPSAPSALPFRELVS